MFLEAVGSLGSTIKNPMKTKGVIKILYCLLSDNYQIERLSKAKSPIEFYNPIIDKLHKLVVINEQRIFKLKKLSLVDSLIIFDCKNMNNYKIYEIYEPARLKKIYGNRVRIEELIKDIKIEPIFIGDVNELENNFKILSYPNFKQNKKVYLTKIVKELKNYALTEKKYKNLMPNFTLFTNLCLIWQRSYHQRIASELDHIRHRLNQCLIKRRRSFQVVFIILTLFKAFKSAQVNAPS